MEVIKCTIGCPIYIKTPVGLGRQFLKQNQIPGHAAPTYIMNTRDLKLRTRLMSFPPRMGRGAQNTLVNVYVDLVVLTRVAGTSETGSAGP